MAYTPASRSIGRAFTLVEILIVVVILGILAAVVVPSFANATEPARQSTFVTNMKSFADAVMLHEVRNGSFPADGSSGFLPPDLDEFINPDEWERITPIGGVWDTEDVGSDYGIGIHFDGSGETRDVAYMAEIDELFDDGDLGTGLFQNTEADRYYLILQGN